MNQLAARPAPSRITGALAVTTVIAVVPLIVLGSVVTTMKFGMVDPQALRSPWYFLAEFVHNNNLAWLIEHGHRQAGWIVGLLAILTAVSACVLDGRMWVKCLTLVSLTAVIIQGLFGIFRIAMHDYFGPNAAWIHGAFAPIVIALFLTQAASMSRNWSIVGDVPRSARRIALWTTGILYLQIVTGGWIRHRDALPGGRLHLMLAFASFALVFQTIRAAMSIDFASFKIPCRVLGVLLTLQLMLGIEAWMGWMKRPFLEPGQTDSVFLQLTRSLHYVIGAILFATVAMITAKLIFAPRSDPSERTAIQEAAG